MAESVLQAGLLDLKKGSSAAKEKKAVSGNSGDDGFGLTSADLVDRPSALLMSPDLDGVLSEDAAKVGRGFASMSLAPQVVKQNGDALKLKVPLPGLRKEHVRVRTEHNTLIIEAMGDQQLANGVKGKTTELTDGVKGKTTELTDGVKDNKKMQLVERGESDKSAADADYDLCLSRCYELPADVDAVEFRMEFPADSFRMDLVRSVMRNGMLTVTVPKVKKE